MDARSDASSPAYSIAGADSHDLAKYPEWRSKPYREALVEAYTEEGVTFQIKANREARHWTQQELAKRMGTGQSAIARLEDPSRANVTLATLQKLAHAFDCALLIKFAPFSELARDLDRKSPRELVAASFDSEMPAGRISHGHETKADTSE